MIKLESDSRITYQIATQLSKLWKDEGILNTYSHRADFQVPDGAQYFFNEIHRLARRGYIPTQTDVLRCRDRTTGFINKTFRIDDVNFEIFDVGGQKGERKKWLQIFQKVDIVFFVVAVSEVCIYYRLFLYLFVLFYVSQSSICVCSRMERQIDCLIH